MDREYQPLPIRELGAGAGLRRPTQPQAARVTLESLALEVMTDLARASPATIRPQAPVEGANQYMISRGGRQHTLVVDYDELPPRRVIDPPLRRAMVRGIFSLSQVARQLGLSLAAGGEVARTFSEIEVALGH
jgi:hypothetical protein